MKIVKNIKAEFLYIPILYLILSVIFFWEVVFQQRWFFEDFFTQKFPFRYFAAVEIHNLSFPLWNPFVFSGMPFFADIQSGVLYPFNLLLSFFVRDNHLSYHAVECQIIFHFMLGAFFMYLFLRSMNLDKFSSFLGGILFVFTGFFFSHAQHSNMLYSGVWLPAIFYCCNQWFKYKGNWLLFCPILLTISIFGGHPQITLYVLYAFTGYFVFLSYSAKKDEGILKYIFHYLIVILLLVLLSAVQILPLAEFLQNTNRNFMDFSSVTKDSLPIKSLLTLFMPDIFNAEYESWQRWEFRCYMGIGSIILALFGIMSRSNNSIKFFSFFALFGLVLSLGENTFLYKILYTLAPGFQFIRVPARLIYFFTFAVSVLAAHGLYFLSIKNREKDRHANSAIRGTFIFSGLLFLFVIPILSYLILPSSLESFKYHFINYYIITLSILLILFLYMVAKTRRFVKFAILILIVLDLFYNRPVFNQIPKDLEKAIHLSPVAETLREETEGTRFYTGNKYWAYANMGLIYRMSNLHGDNQFQLANYSRLDLASPKISRILGAKFIDYSTREKLIETWKDKTAFTVQNNFMINEQRLPRAVFVNQSIIDPLFDLQNEVENQDLDLLKTVYLDRESENFLQNKKQELPEYTITKYENSGNKINIDLKNNTNGFLVLFEIYYPGWRVFVNGREEEVLKANSLFRAVHISEKSNNVEFVFRPRSFIIGSYISSMTLLAMMLLFFFKTRLTHY